MVTEAKCIVEIQWNNLSKTHHIPTAAKVEPDTNSSLCIHAVSQA